MSKKSIFEIFNSYQDIGKLDFKSLKINEQQFVSLIDSELSKIENIVDTQPYTAFLQLSNLISFTNVGIRSSPFTIIKKLENLIQDIKDLVQKLANKLQANGFSIGLGIPFGFFISLSFSKKWI